MTVSSNDTTSEIQTEALFPFWLRLYLGGLVLLGLLANSVLLVATCRSKRERSWTLFLSHLAIVDILTIIFLAPCELLVLTNLNGVWKLPKFACVVFLGADVTLSSAAVYFIVALALHATCVSPGPPPNATFMLVWILAASLGIPYFLLAETIRPRPHLQLCTLPIGPSRTALFLLVAAFKVVLPIVILIPTSLVSSLRMKHVREREQNLVRTMLLLVGAYAVFSLHRAVFCALHVFLPPMTKGPEAFKIPPLTNSAIFSEAAVVFSAMHYLLPAARPLICFLGNPNLRKAVTRLKYVEDNDDDPDSNVNS